MARLEVNLQQGYLKKVVENCEICKGNPVKEQKLFQGLDAAFCTQCKLCIESTPVKGVKMAYHKDTGLPYWIYPEKIAHDKRQEAEIVLPVFDKIEINKAYHTDTFESINLIPNESVDLIHEDIPYGINYQSNFRKVQEKAKFIQNDADLNWLPEHLEQCYRILKQDRHIFIYCNKKVDVVKQLMELYFDKVVILIWDKGQGTGMGDLTAGTKEVTEFIVHGQKGRRPFTNGKRLNQILRHNFIVADVKEHPTPKPESLVAELVLHTTNEKELIFDGFGGRGVSAIVAIKTGRDFITFEKVKDFYDTIEKNILLAKSGYTKKDMQKIKSIKGKPIQTSLF